MARSKQLNASGIKDATFKLVPINANMNFLEMTVFGPENEKYKYEVYADVRQGEISGIKLRLQAALKQAASDHSRVKIVEDKDTNYLHVDIQGSTIQQYSGKRIPN